MGFSNSQGIRVPWLDEGCSSVIIISELIWKYSQILHGDLALRNVLLTEDNVIKICDFGLSKNLYSNINYQKLSDSPLPVKWLALETLNYRY